MVSVISYQQNKNTLKEGSFAMKKFNQAIPALLFTGLATTLFLLFRFVKISAIFGSCFAYFSVADLLMPLTGAVSLGFAGFIAATRCAIRVLLLSQPLSVLVYHIPGLCASAYWAVENKIIALLLPAACMTAFLVHPVGVQAAPYVLYWLIPMVLYFMPKRTVFTDALSSTFIAHCVGSVIWLYANPLTPAFWLGLIPVVAVERFVFALGMTGLYYVGSFIKDAVVKKVIGSVHNTAAQ